MTRPLAIFLAVISLLGFAAAAESQTCTGCIFSDCHTPAVSVPSNLWGELEPADSGILPINRDTTNIGDYGNPEFTPRWTSVDPVTDGSGNWLFAITNFRFQIWRLTDPVQPITVADVGFSQSGLDGILDGHTAEVYTSVRSAPANSNVVAVGAKEQVGLGIFSTSQKSSPALRYQDSGKNVAKVYAANLGGRDYAFAAGAMGGASVRIYDMTAAAARGSACHDSQPSASACPTIHIGTLGPAGLTTAGSISGAGNFVAVSANLASPGGVYVYNVQTPAAPLQVLTGLTGTAIYDLAMWQEGVKYYLAVRSFNEARIYDVSCIGSGACSLGAPIWTQSTTSSARGRVTFSRAGTTPMLYWTALQACSNGINGEMLFDVSAPTSPRALVSAPYWRYYHWDTSTGFNYFNPYEGKFLNNYFYRAGFTVLDVHRWTGGVVSTPPGVVDVSASPNPASVCQSVSFTANGVTNGSGASYIWQVRNSVNNNLITAQTANDLNPFTWNPSSAGAGTYRAFVVLHNTAGDSNPAQSPVVTINAVTPLPGDGTFFPTKVSDNQGAVKFDVQASGATEWSWDFGDSGGVFGPWLTDPVTGPGPTHGYATVGDKTVRVQVRNCAGGPVTSGSLDINVPVANPLVASFAFQFCSGFGSTCIAPTTANFVDTSSGAPTSYDYDWDCKQGGSGCGSFEDPGHATPVNAHAYSTGGTYTPKLRARRGASEESIFTHSAITITGGSSGPTCGNAICETGETSLSCPADCGSPPPPPPPPSSSLQISGPTSGVSGTAYGYTASASGCTPAANGWNWGHDGSANASTTNSISITWSTSGSKSITVTNSGCPGISDNHTVTISAGAGQLLAAFTTQVSGLGVSFNATSSQGAPTSFLWNFGDGQTGSGMTVQHTYAAAGSYTVVLAISRQDPNCAFGVCNAEKSQVVQVGTGGTPTPTPTPTPSPTPIGMCQPDADTFCALNGDFEVTVAWEKRNGTTGVGRLVPSASSDNTGIFYFFDAGNWELLLKVLDGCAFNGHYWVFGGAATDVKYHIHVTDLVTGDVWNYDNAQGHSSDAITDTLAFDTCNVNRSLLRDNNRAAASQLDPRIFPTDPGATPTPTPTPSPTPTPTATPAANVGPCDPDSNTLCTIAERFRVRVSYETRSHVSGNGRVVPATTDNTGVFWFFQQDNWELLVKVLNGCAFNHHYWVFGAGATDVNYTVTVEDLATGATWEYENPQGHASRAITDTSAFDTCP